MADQNQPKKKKVWLWVLLGCGGCFLCVLLSIGVFVAIIFASLYPAYKIARDNVSEQNLLCRIDSESDLEEAYEEFMTSDYQDTVSFSKFKDMYEDNEEFFQDCDGLLPTKIRDFTAFSASTGPGGTTFSYAKYTDDDKRVKIEMVVDEDGDILLNNLEVEE